MLKILTNSFILTAMIMQAQSLPSSAVDQIYDCSQLPRNGAESVRIRQSEPDDIWLEGLKTTGTDAEKVIWKKPFLLTYPVNPYSAQGDSPNFNGQNIEFVDKSGGFRTHQIFRWNGKELKLICVDTDDFSGETLNKLLSALDTGNPRELARYKKDPGFDHPYNYITSEILENALERGHKAATRSYRAGNIAQAIARLALTFDTYTCLVSEIEPPDDSLKHTEKWIASLSGEIIKVNPDKFIPLLNDYAHFLQLQGKHKQSIEVLRTIAASSVGKASRKLSNVPTTTSFVKKTNTPLDAENKLRSLLLKTPANQENLLDLAFVLRNEGKMDEALHWAKQAVEIKKTPQALHLLAIIYGDQGDLKSSLEAYQQSLASLPANNGEGEDITEIIENLKEVLCENASRKKESAQAKDYLNRATPCGLVRWPDNRPIIVCLKPQPYIYGWTPHLTKILKEAFTDWASASGGRLSFSFTEKPLGANITVLWSGPANLLDLGRNPVPLDQGQTIPLVDHQGYYNATIKLYNAGAHSDASTKRICLHEIGHALGLLGHSNNPADIMYCFLKESDVTPKLSLRDRATIRRLYAKVTPPTEKKFYRANACEFLKATEYDQEGSDLAYAGNYSAALTSFQKSINLVPGFFQARMHADEARKHIKPKMKNLTGS